MRKGTVYTSPLTHMTKQNITKTNVQVEFLTKFRGGFRRVAKFLQESILMAFHIFIENIAHP